jgi:hypothetical protein
MPARKRKAAFVEPMLLLRADTLPEGDASQYELKFDGYRALAIKTGGKIQLRSRNDNDFSLRYPASQKLFRRFRTRRSSTAKSSPSINGAQTVMCSNGAGDRRMLGAECNDSTLEAVRPKTHRGNHRRICAPRDRCSRWPA